MSDLSNQINDSTPDLTLIAAIKAQNRASSTALTILVDRHSGTFHNTVRKHAFTKPWLFTDFIADKATFFYQKALTYDPTKKSSFPTYLTSATRFACLDIFNASKFKEIQIEEITNLCQQTDDDCPESPLFKWDCDDVEKISSEDFRSSVEETDVFSYIKSKLETMTPLQKTVINARYFPQGSKEVQWDEIASQTGKCNYWCLQKRDEAVNKLREAIG
jgi:hypothetical protein